MKTCLPGCWKAGALSTRLASSGGLPRCPQGPCPPLRGDCASAALGSCKAGCSLQEEGGRRARSAPAEPWARRAFPRLSPGWSPRCVRGVSVTRGPGALTHLADSILFPHPPPASLPSLPAGPPPPYSACSLATSSMPCFHKYEVSKPGSLRRHNEVLQTWWHLFDPP